MKAACYFERGNRRAEILARAMGQGITTCGDIALVRSVGGVMPAGDVAVFYGWKSPEIAAAYRDAGLPFVFIDIGYWKRIADDGGRFGYHRVAVNARDPAAYLRRGHSPERLHSLGVRIQPWRKRGSHIVVAGMSAKAAPTYGLEPECWEQAAVAELRRHTGRPIVYRPKPPKVGVEPIELALRDAWALVAHHSNACIDALVQGIPIYCEHGAPALMSMPSLADIETPHLPGDREGFLADLAWTQFTLAEMRDGICWQHLKNEGLI